MSSNILLITDSYPPEIRSAADLMEELAIGLVQRGYNVTVATTYPKYNLSETHKAGAFPSVTAENSVKVIRIRTMVHHKVNYLMRGIAHLLMPFIFIFRLVSLKLGKIDTVLVYSPPLTLALVGGFCKYWYKAKFLLNVQDIFPQNAVDLGILKNKAAIKGFELIESLSYRLADLVLAHSKSNLLFLQQRKAVPDKKAVVLHNWINIEQYANVSKSARLETKLMILFAGVIGPAQGLDFLLKVAELIKGHRDVTFLLAGDGMERPSLENEVKIKGLSNIIFKDFVSKDEYPKLLDSADIGLVCLSSKNKTPVVPGKILGYMAASKPVLGFLNKESDAHEIIKDAKCGYTAYSDDLEMAVSACKRMILDKAHLDSIGKNGFEYVKNHFDKEKCLNLLAEHL